MKGFNNLIFEDLMDRFKWYPKKFRLAIFIKDDESKHIFEKEIDKLDINWNKKKIYSNGIIYQKDPNQILCIRGISNFQFLGSRANAIIFDNSVPMSTVNYIIVPMANIEPSYGAIAFQKSTLIKDFKGEPTSIAEDYQINLGE